MNFNLYLMILEMFNLGIFVLLFYRLKHHFGFAPLFLLIGTISLFANVLASFLYIDFLSFLVSPGSIVLFASILYAILLIYLNEGKEKAKNFAAGLILSNIVLSFISFVTALQMESGSKLLFIVPSGIFFSNIRLTFAGIIALVVDVFLLIKFYEFFLSKGCGRTASIFLSLWFALIADSLIFVMIGFGESAVFMDIFRAHVIGKTFAALFYGTLLSIYQAYFGWESN